MDNYYSNTAYRFNPKQHYNQGHKVDSVITTELIKANSQGGLPPAWLEYDKRLPLHGGEGDRDATPEDLTTEDLQTLPMRLDHEILRGVSYGEASWLYAFGTLAYAIGKVGTWLIGIAGCITMFIMLAQGFGIKAIQGYLVLLSIPLTLWGAGKAALHLGSNFIFTAMRPYFDLNRRTGMVTIYKGKGQVRAKVPFAEMAAELSIIRNHQGFVTAYSLWLRQTVKPHEDIALSRLYGAVGSQQEALRLWDCLHTYMDINQPLPDLPMLEAFRHLDPTTAAYDQKTRRPPRRWRDLSEEEFRAKAEAINTEQQQRFAQT
ncbi:hypothetical protein QCD60_10350 [Pokkaliibacter sp. MBI-7]|uniref:hypothetical protein n=1 Tax=Pokkaliibacter sp. MBI-7 TaxID=3040600 RepID=UPI00244CACA9|nr:hypothetical protein [Pokkaliibacter sp. MBI-7]MDH2432967.1 hypothetical protein [Pokkaliibacter sp. MBI-7]